MQRRRSYTTNRRGHSVAALVVFAVLSMNIACHSDQFRRTVIAANEGWTVAAVGPVDKADVQVGFEVTRSGSPYAGGTGRLRQALREPAANPASARRPSQLPR